MHAILLAAGRGRRFGVDEPKVLVDVAGRSLLDRHLANMKVAGISQVTIVTGFACDQLEAALASLKAAGRVELTVETLHNDLFQHGSLVSLQRAVDRLTAEGGIWMDADVLYPAQLLRRLVTSSHPNCVLLDGRSSEQGEEMMLAIKDGRVRRIARRVGNDWDVVGESVGFFKVDQAGAAEIKRVVDQEVDAGRLDQEHEDGLNAALETIVFGHERVDDLAWTEIDFQQDLSKAESLVQQVDDV